MRVSNFCQLKDALEVVKDSPVTDRFEAVCTEYQPVWYLDAIIFFVAWPQNLTKLFKAF